MKLNKKANAQFMIVFTVVAVVTLTIFTVFMSFGVLFNVEMFKAAERIAEGASADIASINDPIIRGAVQDSLDTGFAAQENTIKTHASLYQYGWVFMIGVVFLSLFLMTRSISERNAGIT